MKHIILILSFIVAFCVPGISQVTISNKFFQGDTIKFGMCKISQSIETEFVISNDSDEELKILNTDPSFYLGTPNDMTTNSYEEFELTNLTFPAIIPAKSKVEFTINFRPRAETAVYPSGHKIALLKIGVFSSSISGQPEEQDFVAYKEFILEAKKNESELEFYYDKIALDTVCVNPSHAVKFNNWFQNNSENIVTLGNEQIINEGAGSDGLTRKDIQGSNILEYLEIRDRNFEFYPIHSGNFDVTYHLEYLKNGESDIRSADFEISAFVAEQHIEVFDAIGAKVRNDTIDLGDIRIGNTQKLQIIFRNIGNLPFGISSQSILQEQLDNNEATFTFNKYFLPGGKHLQPDDLDTLEVMFKPDRRGKIIGRLNFQSDISVRDIKNVNYGCRNLEFILAAKGVAPEIAISSDTLDFGNVVISDNCPIILDSAITIYNSGNQLLRISEISIYPESVSPFEFENYEMEIPPGESKKLSIIFNSTDLPAGNKYSYYLLFRSNALKNDICSLLLSAATEPMKNFAVTLSKTISAKSGREIMIPILVDKEKIASGNSLDISMAYDKSILQYSKYDNISTAAENTWKIDVTDDNSNNALRIQMSASPEFFFKRDTLIKLYFHTYLSNNISTPIIINSVLVGNDNCENIFCYDLTNSSSVFSIDSICGIEFKTLPREGDRRFRLENTYPNPCNSYSVLSFELPYKCMVNIEIIDSEGRIVKTLVSKCSDAGNYSVTYNCSDLIPGAYYCRMRTPGYNKTINLRVTR